MFRRKCRIQYCQLVIQTSTPSTGLTPAHVCACPKHRPKFPTPYVVVLLVGLRSEVVILLVGLRLEVVILLVGLKLEVVILLVGLRLEVVILLVGLRLEVVILFVGLRWLFCLLV